jgi:hypothetical protein
MTPYPLNEEAFEALTEGERTMPPDLEAFRHRAAETHGRTQVKPEAVALRAVVENEFVVHWSERVLAALWSQ